MYENMETMITLTKDKFDIRTLLTGTPIRKFIIDCGVNIYIKEEGYNPTGSLKDRPAAYMLQKAIEEGRLEDGQTIICPSSGSFGCALAYFGAVMDYPVQIITNDKCTEENFNFMRLIGADVQRVGKVTKDSREYCEKLIAEQPDKYVFMNQLEDWENPNAHFSTTGPEILKDLPDVDAVAASMGSGGTLLGCANFFIKNKPDVKIIASVGTPDTSLAGTYRAGMDQETVFIQEILKRELADYQSTINLDQAHQRISELRKRGIFTGPQTGGVLQAVRNAINDGTLQSGDNVVIISGDSGWKNIQKIQDYQA